MAQGYITPDGLKTFLEMGKLYEKAGGNDIYHEKLLPDIESLEVRYTKDSVTIIMVVKHYTWLPIFLL